MMLRASSLAFFLLTSSLLTTSACISSTADTSGAGGQSPSGGTGTNATTDTSSGSGTGTGPGGANSGNAKARTAAVQSALTKPTGTVDATSAKATLVHSRSITDFQAFSDLISALPGVGSSDCAPSGTTAGALEVSCAIDGGTGSVHYALDGSADIQYIDATFSKACTEEGVCVNGTLALAVTSSTTGAAVTGRVDVDVTTGGATVHAEWGYSLESSDQGQSAKLVLFEAGGTFVIDASVSGNDASGSVSLNGANGQFACSFDGGGEQGTCSGSGSSEFTW